MSHKYNEEGLQDRAHVVGVDKEKRAGVSQGTTLSPTLFTLILCHTMHLVAVPKFSIHGHMRPILSPSHPRDVRLRSRLLSAVPPRFFDLSASLPLSMWTQRHLRVPSRQSPTRPLLCLVSTHRPRLPRSPFSGLPVRHAVR